MEDRELPISDGASSITRASRFERLGRLCEIGAVLVIAGSAVIVAGKQSILWMVLATAGFVSGFVLSRFAIAFASKSSDETLRMAERIKYEITSRRIRTLIIVKTPRDAIEALEKIRTNPEVLDQKCHLTEKDLVRRLINELGSERAGEIKGIVLKYTKISQADSRGVSGPAHPEMAAVPS